MEVSDFVRTLLEKRGLTGLEEVEAFLAPDYERHTHDPFLIADMDVAVDRLLHAIEAGERIAVYADFDCDGIPGAALLSDLFRKIGYENFEVYLPHRDREGYGFHTEAIAQLAERKVKLIITVDVGTTAIDAVAFAKEKGVDVIVTDHHEILGDLPEAIAVLNPKRPPALSGVAGYPFPHLCGSGVAYKLAQATLIEGKRRGLAPFTGIPDGWEKWLLDMVAIATVADMVPLVGENRALVHFGLQVLRKSRRVGIDALVAKLRLRKASLTEDDIGFSIAPRINAASRMDEPDLALKLLTTGDREEAKQLADTLERLNASRKGVVAGIVREARKHMYARFAPEDTIVVLGDPKWKPALLGLAANSLMAERRGAVCLWGRDANGKLKGSCRADESISLPELFEKAGDIFEERGGHARSGGFSISHERVHSLPDALKEAAKQIGQGAKAQMREADARLALPDVSRTLFSEVSRLAPFGIGNPKPIFHVERCVVTEVRRFGKESNHVELALECRTSGMAMRAFEFFKSPDDFTFAPAQGVEANVIATVERDTYRGGLALRLIDVLPN